MRQKALTYSRGGGGVSKDIRPLKQFARERFPSDHPIQVIHLEEDIIEQDEEAIGKISVYYKLARLKG
ncbi:MAG: hypothetical protein EU535_08255 [Promethearchaeota archaeon]|nr:MAG: hypothetical protein EU535_08255 [Candidatus Lokiarchaeota archaeon]